jgi:hypothetical protein
MGGIRFARYNRLINTNIPPIDRVRENRWECSFSRENLNSKAIKLTITTKLTAVLKKKMPGPIFFKRTGNRNIEKDMSDR